MIVLHIIEALGGGVYSYFKDLTYYFSQDHVRSKFKTYIIYNDKRNEIIPEKIKKDFGEQIELIKVDMSKNINPLKDIKSSFTIAKIIKDINPNVIHLHSSKASVIGRLSSFLSFNKHKIFYTPHGYSFLRRDISKQKQVLFKSIEKYTQKIFGGTTIACGDTEYKIAQKLGKTKLVRNGINLKKIKGLQQINQKNKSSLRFGIVGRITEQKNPKLFNDIALKFPQYEFIWIGDGELNNIITAENIKITGWLFDENEVYSYLNTIDVFLQTSLWEGLPIALLEALALKKPIVSTNIIGNKDVVINNYNGFLFNDISELDSILPKFENLNFRKNMGINAFNSCKKNFDINVNFKVLEGIYSS